MNESLQDQHLLTLAQDATVKTIGAVRSDLLSAFDSANDITIDVTGVGDADLTLVQLIESARHTAASGEKRFGLAAPAAGDLRAMLERGGFVATAESRKFWLHEDLQ